MGIKKTQFFGIVFVLLASLSFAAIDTANIKNGLTSLCTFINSLVPVVVMLMLVGAGAVYAGGQMMGAETRARANVWATSMLVGAVIGVVIIVVSPSILSLMYTGTAGGNFATCTF